GNKAGLARNGSPWFVNPAPEGLQAAYIQLNSAGAILSQPVNFPTLGNYVISFSMVRRGSGLQANDIAVSMDGVTLGTVLNTSQPDDIWRTFSIPYNCTVTGNHTLAFVGTRGGADNASAIDNVQISGGVGTTAFQVSFTPTAGGLRTATLSIANNDSTQNPFGIILDGTGVAPVPPVINAQSLAVSGNGTFQFTFTNTNNFAFSVLATTNASLPVSNWTVLGAPTNLGGGLYQFADPAATNFPFRFYQLRFP
ncbi:MAG: hypothetical protein JWR26_154, partial [Pedosphaera sp.]|nr:hypothetical protein [Pedosphaera sp.]